MELHFPSERLGIPMLRLDRQATAVPAPFKRWGRGVRKSRMPGCWHFYTDDYRFSRVASRPRDLTNSACAAAVELNVSVRHDTPPVLALHATYRKRLAARQWQEDGVDVLVDLNVAGRYLEDNLRGVPRGWRAFVTRGSAKTLAELEAEVDAAAAIAGTRELLLVVYAGPAWVRDLAERRGWIWYPEEADEARGRTAPAGPTGNRAVSATCSRVLSGDLRKEEPNGA